MKWYGNGEFSVPRYGPRRPLGTLDGSHTFFRYHRVHGKLHCVECGFSVCDHGSLTGHIQLCPGDDVTDGVRTAALHNPVYGYAV